MSRSRSARRLSLALLVVAVAPGRAFPDPASGASALLRVAQGPQLDRALDGALRKIAKPACRLLLDEFKDKDGRSLSENLATWDRSVEDYLRTTPFRDGAAHPLCRAGDSALVSVPGMRPVFVCPRFHELAARDPWSAESWVIHEMLHTLGLGENPPSSREITRRVNERCQ